MAITVGAEMTTRRPTRVEYERVVDLGVFQPGERRERLDGAPVVREPQGPRHAAIEVHRQPEASGAARCGSRYASIQARRPPATVTPLIAPDRTLAEADLLP